MSTISIWSAARTTASGMVSRCLMPVISSTTSFIDSRCCTLTVEITSMPAREELLDVLPALLVARAGHVGVRELVDQRHLRRAREHRVDVHLLERRAAVRDDVTGHDLEVADLRLRVRSAVGLDEPDDDVGAAARPPGPFVRASRRSCRRRARHRGRCEACRAPCPKPTDSPGRGTAASWSSARLSSSTFTAFSPRTPSVRLVVLSSIELVAPSRRRVPVRRRPARPAAGRWPPRCRGRGPSRTRSPRRPAPCAFGDSPLSFR